MASRETDMSEKEFEIKITGEFHGHPGFYKLLEKMAKMHNAKNHDYARDDDPLSNLRACKSLGIQPFVGVMVRLQDKWDRIISFITKGELKVKSESVKDTLMDNAVYSLLAIILLEEDEKPSSVREMTDKRIDNKNHGESGE